MLIILKKVNVKMKNESITKNLLICENCEWCIEHKNLHIPFCLLKNKQKGLFETCNNFKKRTGNHINFL